MPRSGSRWADWAALDPRVWQMAFARSVSTLGLSLVMTFLGIYVVNDRGYPAWLYGIIALVANLGQSWSSARAGNLSDRIGRLPLIRHGLFVRSIVIAALGTQVFLDAPLWSLALNMVLSSMLRGCFEPVAYALVADVVQDHQRIAAFGLQRMSTNLGWAIGPSLGGVLTLVVPYGIVFYLSAAGLIAAGLMTLKIVDPVVVKTTSTKSVAGELRGALREGWRDPMMRLLLAGTFFSALLTTQMFSTMAIYMTRELGMRPADVGLLYTVNGVGVLLLQLPAIRLLTRIGADRALPWASILAALGFALIGLQSGFAAGVEGGALVILTVTCAEVVFGPAHQTAIAEIAEPARRGRAYGTVAFVQMVGIAFSPLLGGVLLDTIGDHHVTLWLVIASIGVAQTGCFMAFVRRRRAHRTR